MGWYATKSGNGAFSIRFPIHMFVISVLFLSTVTITESDKVLYLWEEEVSENSNIYVRMSATLSTTPM